MRKPSKYIFFLILGCMCMNSLQAQHYVGARIGYGSGTARLYPKEEMSSIWGLYSGGVSWKFFTSERYVGGIEVDALFMQQGFKYLRTIDPNEGLEEGQEELPEYTESFQRKVNSVMVPVFWQPHAYLFKRQMRVFLNLGVTFSYNISSTYENITGSAGIVDKGNYNFKLTRDNRWGYGLCGGGGIGWSFNRIEVFSEVRYYIGYSDILKNTNKYDDNQFLRSPMDGLQISAGVFFRLGKGGIRSKASKRVEEKLQRREIERLMKPAETETTDPELSEDVSIDIIEDGEIEFPTRPVDNLDPEPMDGDASE